jgi:hypothetical protein
MKMPYVGLEEVTDKPWAVGKALAAEFIGTALLVSFSLAHLLCTAFYAQRFRSILLGVHRLWEHHWRGQPRRHW